MYLRLGVAKIIFSDNAPTSDRFNNLIHYAYSLASCADIKKVPVGISTTFSNGWPVCFEIIWFRVSSSLIFPWRVFLYQLPVLKTPIG